MHMCAVYIIEYRTDVRYMSKIINIHGYFSIKLIYVRFYYTVYTQLIYYSNMYP